MTATQLLPLGTLPARGLDAWRRLARAAAEPNPFFEPEYALPLARGTDQLADAALLVVQDGDDWIACLPVRRLGSWHRVPLPSLSTWRAHTLYALLGTPLVDRDRLAEGADALVAGLMDARGSFFSSLEWLDQGGPVLAALERALARRGIEPLRFERFERAFLRRRPDPTYTDETVSIKHRREYARQRRRLAEELGAALVVEDRAGDPAAVDELIDLELHSGVGENGTAIGSDPGHASFFREMCRGFAAEGRLQLLTMTAGTHTLAIKCNVVSHSGAFMLKIAFDAAFKRFSPGMLLELDNIDAFHARPALAWMDSCADANNAMINRLWPDRRVLTTLTLPVPGPRAALARPAVRAARTVRDRLNERTAT